MPIKITKQEYNNVKEFMFDYIIFEFPEKIKTESPYFDRVKISTCYDQYIEYCSEQDMQSNILNMKAFVCVVLQFHRVTLKCYCGELIFRVYSFALYNYFTDENYYINKKLLHNKTYRQQNKERISQQRKNNYAEKKQKRNQTLLIDKVEFN